MMNEEKDQPRRADEVIEYWAALYLLLARSRHANMSAQWSLTRAKQTLRGMLTIQSGYWLRDSPNGTLRNIRPLKQPHCGLMPAIFITLSHFAASAAM